MHLRSLAEFDYDSVLLPYSYVQLQLPSYRADVEALLAVCGEHGVAVQTIKAIARGHWKPNAPTAGRQSWYEPVSEADAISRAVSYVLAQPNLFLASPSAYDQRPAVLAAAEDVVPPSPAALRRDVAELGIAPLFDEAEAT